jgi:phage shock protein C
MEPKRLCRSNKNKILAGVCGGIGEYFGIDPTIVRVLAIIIPGIGWLTYLLFAILMPAAAE